MTSRWEMELTYTYNAAEACSNVQQESCELHFETTQCASHRQQNHREHRCHKKKFKENDENKYTIDRKWVTQMFKQVAIATRICTPGDGRLVHCMH